jgi:hypothetical protein
MAGGDGGLYGGGGGGPGYCQNANAWAAGGNGKGGLIVLTFTAAATPPKMNLLLI